jgi:hypothetical protein
VGVAGTPGVLVSPGVLVGLSWDSSSAGRFGLAQISHFLFLDEKKQKFPVIPGLIVLNAD